MTKYVYDFSEGNKDMKDLLGGKGANLAEMTNMGLPVPHGFTITTEACLTYLAEGGVAIGVRCGEAYVDVGTLHGYREATQLLDARRDARPTDTLPTPMKAAAGRSA